MEAMTSEREAFEKWMGRVHPSFPLSYHQGAYVLSSVRDLWNAFSAGRAHLAQPAQAVDVWAVLVELRAAADQEGATMGQCFQWWRLLTRALSGEKAGPVGDGWQPIETAPSDKRIIGCWLGAPGCHEVDVAVYVTQGVDRPRWVAPDDSFCEYGKPDLWMPLPQPPDSSDGMDYPDGPWAEGWAERSGVLLPASPTPDKEG